MALLLRDFSAAFRPRAAPAGIVTVPWRRQGGGAAEAGGIAKVRFLAASQRGLRRPVLARLRPDKLWRECAGWRM